MADELTKELHAAGLRLEAMLARVAEEEDKHPEINPSSLRQGFRRLVAWATSYNMVLLLADFFVFLSVASFMQSPGSRVVMVLFGFVSCAADYYDGKCGLRRTPVRGKEWVVLNDRVATACAFAVSAICQTFIAFKMGGIPSSRVFIQGFMWFVATVLIPGRFGKVLSPAVYAVLLFVGRCGLVYMFTTSIEMLNSTTRTRP